MNVDVTTVVVIGLFFVLVSLAVFAIALFNITKIKKVKDYCTERFDKIEEMMKAETKNKEEVISLLKQVRGYFK